MKAYVLVPNTSSAFSVERILSKAAFMEYEFSLSLTPTPKVFSNSCNLCVCLESNMPDSEHAAFLEAISQSLERQNITHEIKVL